MSKLKSEVKSKKGSSKTVWLVVIGGLGLLACCLLTFFLVLGLLVWNYMSKSKTSSDTSLWDFPTTTLATPTTELPTYTSTPTPTEAPTPTEELGTIEGSLSYPSDYIPPQKVCAQLISTGKLYCTTERVKDGKYKYNYGYQLSVPAGIYYVYAQLIDNSLGSYKAYYTKFSKCGIDASGCPDDHTKLKVTVQPGGSIEDIDPDWWAM